MEEIKVDMNEYKTTTAPNILTSGGLGPCICVGAIYKKKGYMTHFVTGAGLCELNRLLDDLKRDVKTKSSLKVYVAGGELRGAKINSVDETQIEYRKLTLDRIADYGFKTTEVRWNWPDSTQELFLILSENRAVYEEDLIDSRDEGE
jgi:hypothetical protein